TALIAYPLIPWVGVMAAGYAFGTLYDRDRESRRKWLFAVGGAATVLFVVVRLINIYGDSAPWSAQSSSAATFLSFLNTSKYPPSLLYLLMTIGPSIVVLGLTDSIDGKAIWQRIGITFGRVPMFYYILQWFVAHTAGIVLSLLAGKEVGYSFVNALAQGQAAPPEYGFSLCVVYAAWITGLLLLYPLCVFWGNLKRRDKHWLLSYL
ncbi:MAG: hypothetical protein ABIP78_07720, partial [Pyrinomonadaceae bacterium]